MKTKMRFAALNLAFCVMAAGMVSPDLQAQPVTPPPAPPAPPAPSTVPAAVPATVPAAAPAAQPAPVPKIQFAEPIHDFGRVKVNEPAKYDFVFTNTGQAMLEVTAVHPGCGCTAAGNWTRQVAPAKTGIIPIQFNGAGNPGPFGKSITITCNDPAQQTVVLQFKGVLWKPVEVTPQYAVFNVTEDSVSNATSVVSIVNNEETPLILSTPEYNNAFFTATIKTNEPGKKYEVTIRTVPPLPANNTAGAITIKTCSSNMPVIQINTAAMIMPTLAVNPPTIILPPAPNTNNVRPVIYVRNNGMTPFKLSDAVVNAQGVDVQIKEIEPGRYASLTLTFPPEFTVPTSQQIHLNLKTGLAHHPSLDVPVYQRPAL